MLWQLTESPFTDRVRRLCLYIQDAEDRTMNDMLDHLRAKGELTGVPEALVPYSTDMTGCTQAVVLFLSMVMADSPPDDSADIDALVAMIYFYTKDRRDKDYLKPSVVMSFSANTGVEYIAPMAYVPLYDLWRRDTTACRRYHQPLNLLYQILLLDTAVYEHKPASDELIAKFPPFPYVDKSRPSLDVLAADTHSLDHVFLLRVIGKYAFIFHAYFGYYTPGQWLDYTTDLTIDDTLVPLVSATWHRPLLAHPRYRCKLTLDDVDRLAIDVDSLTGMIPKTQTYARITGVLPQHIAPMKVCLMRYCY